MNYHLISSTIFLVFGFLCQIERNYFWLKLAFFCMSAWGFGSLV